MTDVTSSAHDATAGESVVGDLSPAEVRVLGCLVEKQATTPGAYPLTLNALRTACNQATSRDPVVDYGEQEVQQALLSLRDRRLARPVRNPGDRVTKFAHTVPDRLGLDPAEVAVLSVLLLRGPQTIGEVRTRTRRQHDFADIDAVGRILAVLAERDLVVEVPRGPGQKEDRWLHRVGDHGTPGAPVDAPAAGPSGATPGPPGVAQPDTTTAAVWLAGARAVAAALADPSVARAWERPSVLEHQAVSSLAGHLARGAVWVVGDYLDADEPDGPPDFDSAAAYLGGVADMLGPDDHVAIRDRGAAVAAVGHDHLLRRLGQRLDALAERVPAVEPDRLVAVFGGLSIRFDDYLATRVVEQAVHLDDLTRSVEGLDVVVPQVCLDLAVSVGIDVVGRAHGDRAALRALFRAGFADDVLPVL